MKSYWNRENTFGLLIGIISPLIFLPIVLYILSISKGSTFLFIWDLMSDNPEFRSKYISLSLISNLLWFYYFLNREKYDYTKGIILGVLCYAPYMIYVNLIM
jgi:hypothetical protein